MGDPREILPKEGIIPTLPMPWFFGEKIVFSGVISQVDKAGKYQGFPFFHEEFNHKYQGQD